MTADHAAIRARLDDIIEACETVESVRQNAAPIFTHRLRALVIDTKAALAENEALRARIGAVRGLADGSGPTWMVPAQDIWDELPAFTKDQPVSNTRFIDLGNGTYRIPARININSGRYITKEEP